MAGLGLLQQGHRGARLSQPGGHAHAQQPGADHHIPARPLRVGTGHPISLRMVGRPAFGSGSLQDHMPDTVLASSSGTDATIGLNAPGLVNGAM